MNFKSLKEKLKIPSRSNKNEQDSESFLALTLTLDTVTACVWHLDEEKVKVTGISSKRFTNPQNIIHEAAVAIDKAAETATSEVDKVVFGLSSNWFEVENLSNQTAKLLDSLSHDLELSAQAYVSLATAINHFLKVEEGITPNAVLLGIFNDYFEVHLANNNSIISTESAKFKANIELIVDLIKKLKEKHQQLPSRLVVYGHPDEDLTKKLANRNWQDIFMHELRIDLLDEHELNQSVAFAQAADILGHELIIPPTNKPQPQAEKRSQQEKVKSDLDNNFGFVANEDILRSKSSEDKITEENPEEAATIKRPEEAPELETAKREETLQNRQFERENYAVELDSNISPSIPQGVKTHKRKVSLPIPNISGFLSLIKLRLSPKSIGIVLIATLVLGSVIVFAAGLTLTNAQVIIKVNAKPQESDFKAQVIAQSADIPAGQIPGVSIQGSSQNSQKLVATGSKKSGTKATGQVKIFNWDKQSSKTFASGTQIITKDGLKFALDSEVQVASRSATNPGESKVAATAADIGPKYNINSGVDLAIVGFDEVFYSAISETAFTGGDEKQITVASKEDLDRLEKSLTDSLTEKAEADLSSKSQGKKIYNEAKTIKITKKEFDKKADEEASLINLNMSLEISALTFDENDLKTYLAKTAQDSADQKLEARSENIEILNVTVKSQKDILILNGKYRANLTPKLDEESLKERIAGTSVKKAREIIKGVSEVADVQITITPSIPFVENLPRNKSKITFKIEKN